MNLCVIPARGGSKRIPKKNIKPICGKPLISYAIQTAKESELFDRIVVSTDDLEIATISKEWGAEVLERPKELADDFTPSIDVFEDVIQKLNRNGYFKFACMIYPTALFLKPTFLKEGLKRLKESDSSFSFSATTYDFPIWRGFEIVEGKGKMIFPEFMETRSQDLKEVYHDAAQFYWKKLSSKEKFRFDGNIPILLPRYLVQDIDTPQDLIQAELKFKILKEMERL